MRILSRKVFANYLADARRETINAHVDCLWLERDFDVPSFDAVRNVLMEWLTGDLDCVRGGVQSKPVQNALTQYADMIDSAAEACLSVIGREYRAEAVRRATASALSRRSCL